MQEDRMVTPNTPASIGPYADVFSLSHNAWGACIAFGVHDMAPEKGKAVVREVSRVYMSHAHIKAMAFVLHREVGAIEKHLGSKIPIAADVFDVLKISPEFWEFFWQPNKTSSKGKQGVRGEPQGNP